MLLCFYDISFFFFSPFTCLFLYFCLLWFLAFLFLNTNWIYGLECKWLCVFMFMFLYVTQWGPALYLCYKRAVAKANALVYEAGEWEFLLSFVSCGYCFNHAVCKLQGSRSGAGRGKCSRGKQTYIRAFLRNGLSQWTSPFGQFSSFWWLLTGVAGSL